MLLDVLGALNHRQPRLDGKVDNDLEGDSVLHMALAS